MDLLHIVALAVVQGVTEFLPVGSEAHLALIGRLFPIGEAGTAILIALHLGTVLAVVVYFRTELLVTVIGIYHLAIGRNSENARFAVKLFVGSAPVIAIGTALILLGFKPAAPDLTFIAWTMLGFGLLLFLADRLGMTLRRIEHMSGGTALFIGLAQAIALVPGTGRIGLTMTAARLFGFERTDAARFSMLVGIVPILAIAGWHSWGLAQEGAWFAGYDGAIAAAVAFVAAYATIAFLMQWLRRGTLTPFALYRLVVGGALLYAIYT